MGASTKILLIGGSGFIGKALMRSLSEAGYSLNLLSRDVSKARLELTALAKIFTWTSQGDIPQEALDKVSVVINLAGESVADHWWTAEQKKRIRLSRVETTRALARALKNHPVELVIQSSAIGFYGFDSDRSMKTESSSQGKGFLPDVCHDWEAEGASLRDSCQRVVFMRLGLVLGWGGGALPRLADVYSSGFGAVLGDGNQWMNWIHVEDVCRFVGQSIVDRRFEGIYNLVAPTNSRNIEFHQHLKSYYSTIPFLKAPSLGVRAMLGQRSELVLKGPRVVPKRLEDAAFSFTYPELPKALDNLYRGQNHYGSHILYYQQWLPVSLHEIWEFVSDEKNLEQITPPWLHFKVLGKSTDEMEKNTQIRYSLRLHGAPLRWKSLIAEWRPQNYFVDTQITGPYKLWYHEHRFVPLKKGTLIEDVVQYRLPFFPFGECAFPLVKRDVTRIFSYRKKALADIFFKST